MEFIKCPHTVPGTFYSTPAGYFGVYNTANYLQWHSCRDTFQATNNEEILKTGLYLSCNNIENPALFLSLIEKRLRLETRSEFGTTNVKEVLYIKISPWWLETKVKKSFLTLMLRIGIENFDPKARESLSKIINKGTRGKATSPAIGRFLRGFTKYQNPRNKEQTDFMQNRGWVQAFSRVPLIKARKMLIK